MLFVTEKEVQEMGRIGVSYIEVENVATELQSRGISPTVDNVREALGTGSRSTIAPYLKQWRNKQSVGLPPELVTMIKELYQQLQQAADLRINEIEQQKQQAVAALEQKCEQLTRQNTQLQEYLEGSNLKLRDNLNLADQLKTELDREKNLNSNHLVRIREYEARLSDGLNQTKLLEKQLKNAQVNFELYSETLLTQHQEEKKANEYTLTLLNQEITILKNQLSSTNERCLELTEKQEKSNLEKQKLEKEWYEQRSKTMSLQEQLKLQDFVYQQTEEKYNQLSRNHKELKNIYESKQQSIEIIERDNLVLKERVRAMEILLEKSEHALQALQSERLFLAQENSSLKAEFKWTIENKQAERV